MKKASAPSPPDPSFLGDYDEWVEDGFYEFVYVKHSYVIAFKGRCKMFVEFRITDPGEYYGKILKAYYNVFARGKKYIPPKNGRLSREMATLFGRRALKNRSAFSLLKSVVIKGQTRTVLKDSQNKSLSEANKYSVIDRLLKVTVGEASPLIPSPYLHLDRYPNPVKTLESKPKRALQEPLERKERDSSFGLGDEYTT